MQTAKDRPKRFLCRHIFPDGHRCQSPTLQGPTEPEPFCYYHHTTRRPVSTTALRHRKSSRTRCHSFQLPSPADLNNRSGIQLAIGEVIQQIATGDLDPKRAGLLLYGLQIASLNLPKEKELSQPSSPIESFTDDRTLGPLAPITEVGEIQQHEKGPARLMLEELEQLERDSRDTLPYLNAEAQPKSPANPATSGLCANFGAGGGAMYHLLHATRPIRPSGQSPRHL